MLSQLDTVLEQLKADLTHAQTVRDQKVVQANMEIGRLNGRVEQLQDVIRMIEELKDSNL